jgi:hypothetical protein
MVLEPDGADLPQLVPFDSSCALATAKLGPAWSVVKLYAADAANPPESDALVVRNAKGGEYAQFYCVDDTTLPREAVLRDFFLSHVYRDLPGGPTPFELVSPANKAKVADREPTLVWKAGGRTTSWLVEIATDNAFTKPVFTATVVRDTKLQDPTASVKVTPPLRGNTRYRWRVTARNDFGTVVSETRGFRIR